MRKRYKHFFNPLLHVLFAMLLSICQSAAQEQPLVDYHYVLEQIKGGIKQGDFIALRDAGLLLDKPSLRKEVLALLQRHTLFTARELVIADALTSKIFIEFFYEHQQRLEFHELLQAFYLTPIEERAVYYSLANAVNDESTDFTLRLQQHITRLNRDIEAGDTESAQTQITRIGELDMEEGYLFLLELLDKPSFRRLRSNTPLYPSICKTLTKYESIISAKAILNLLKEKIISKPFAEAQLTKLTNIHLDSMNIVELTALLDTAQSLSQVRQLSYEKYCSYKPYYFEHPIDFYGKLFLLTDSIPWLQQNALDDIIQTRHHRTLYFIALKLYQSALDYPKSTYSPDELFEQLQSLIGAEIKIHDYQQQFVAKPNWKTDKEGVLNFLLYWASHHEDYEWDVNRNQFINKTISLTVNQRYKTLIRRLTYTDDSIAWASYIQLTEGKPSEIVALTERYRPALYNHNKKLPSIEYYYLEQLSKLTAFCKRNNVIYQPNENLAKLLDSLNMPITPRDRHGVEKRLLNELKITDLTALEYQACLKSANLDFAYSLGWVLDKAYTQFWNEIATDENQLRIFLKKSYLFSELGAPGSCNLYLKKALPLSADVEKLLSLLESKESDTEILIQIKHLQASREEAIAWKMILTYPVNINMLPDAPSKSYEEISIAIQTTADANKQRLLLEYLTRKPTLEIVPYLMRLLKSSILQTEVINLLENIYAQPTRLSDDIQRPYWLNLWQQDSLSYQQWGRKLLKEKLVQVKAANELPVNELNIILQSPFLEQPERIICLEAMSKIRPLRNIRRLTFPVGISVDKELQYLESLKLTHREWIEIVPILKIDAPQKLLSFFKNKFADLKVKEEGWFYARLFNQGWVNGYLASTQTDKLLVPIKKVLNDYLEDKEVIETEKELALMALVRIEHAGKPLEEQLRLSTQIKVSEAIKVNYQKELLAKITYPQISAALREYGKISSSLQYNFLQADFGIPVFDLSDKIEVSDIIARHLVDNTSQFYSHYLSIFGITFRDEKGKLDFNAIYQMLEYDICLPFSGSDQPRNFYGYGLIKLLESELGLNIGFHPKLNCSENQPCDSLSKRAFYWMRYLEQQRLVSPIQNPRSFNFANGMRP